MSHYSFPLLARILTVSVLARRAPIFPVIFIDVEVVLVFRLLR